MDDGSTGSFVAILAVVALGVIVFIALASVGGPCGGTRCMPGMEPALLRYSCVCVGKALPR